MSKKNYHFINFQLFKRSYLGLLEDHQISFKFDCDALCNKMIIMIMLMFN